jgi:NADH-quinone oxidoreductase subunit J
MNGTLILFYFLSAIVLVFAAVSMFTRKIFRAAICLLASLVGIAGIYLLWDMDFIAALQIIIYVGGIVVLIIFSIFLTHRASEKLARQSLIRRVRAMIIAIAGFGFTAWVLLSAQFPEASPAASNQLSVEQIGIQMMSYDKFGYLLPFEVISFLLLGALVGSITIAIKHKKI